MVESILFPNFAADRYSFVIENMKNTANILSTLVLSFVMVWMSIGFVLIQCEHTGHLSLPSTMMQEDECLTMQHEGCMRLYVKKLSPSNPSQTASFNLEPAQFLLLPTFVTICSLLGNTFVVKAKDKTAAYTWHSPPRHYLRKLTTLLI